MQCGLLGRKLGHSYSPQIHAMLGNYAYHLFEQEPEELETFLKNGDFRAINVTIPYKKDVIPYLDELTPTARKMGAVNTIVRREDGSLLGHNTDYYGFSSLLKRSGMDVAGKKVLVLGSGGASQTVCAVLKERNACVAVISRSGENNYDNLSRHEDAALIVNTTPVGMYPNTGISPVDLRLFPKLKCVLDVVYNPARTQLLLDAESRGIPCENGLWMLVAQAKEAAEYFTGSSISDECISKIHSKLRSQMENIVLIGMPGCGKSTIGQILAEKTGKQLLDADAEIVKAAGKPIPEIFAESGEPGFRAIETKVLAELGKKSGCIIATGGGCVTRIGNLPSLYQNGSLFWIKRDVALLPRDGRPLSVSNDLQKMYEVRKPMYEAFADYTIENDGSPEETASKIISMWEDRR